jgi:hypothetical protein
MSRRYSDAEKESTQTLIAERQELSTYQLAELTGISQKTIHLWGTQVDPDRFSPNMRKNRQSSSCSKVIRVSSKTYERLEGLAKGFDTPNAVIERLLDHFQTNQTNQTIERNGKV